MDGLQLERPETRAIRDSICRDPRTAGSVRILKILFLKGNAGTYGPPIRSEFSKRDEGTHGPSIGSKFLKGKVGIHGPSI